MKFIPLAFLLQSCLATLPAYAVQTSGDASVCFVPSQDDCALVAVSEINAAKSTIDLQAYSFTEPRIIAALVAAHARGVKVRAILDKTDISEKGGGAQGIVAAGIPTAIDYIPRIAHNKVIVIDGTTVIGGSFNYSTSADRFNAENMTIIHDPVFASFYEQNFERRLAVSRPYTGQ